MPKLIPDRQMHHARLFLAGPLDVRGNWERSAHAAGYERVPSRDGRLINLALERVRRELEMAAGTPDPEMPAPAPDHDLEELQALIESGRADWDDMAILAKRVLGKIAVGRVSASPGQVVSLKEIVNRSEGKIGQERSRDDTDVIRVVVLPAIDHTMGPVIDLGRITDLGEDDDIPGVTLRQAMENRR